MAGAHTRLFTVKMTAAELQAVCRYLPFSIEVDTTTTRAIDKLEVAKDRATRATQPKDRP